MEALNTTNDIAKLQQCVNTIKEMVMLILPYVLCIFVNIF